MKKYDVVIVLGFDVTEEGLLPEEGKSRVQLASEIVASGEANKVIFSGNVSHLHSYTPNKTEAEAMGDYALAIGMKKESVLLESASRNTYENAIFCKKIIDTHNWHSVILVTSKFHLTRSKELFNKIFVGDYSFDYRTCINRLNKTERELIGQMEKIKTNQLHNKNMHIVDPTSSQMQTLLSEYLQQRNAS